MPEPAFFAKKLSSFKTRFQKPKIRPEKQPDDVGSCSTSSCVGQNQIHFRVQCHGAICKTCNNDFHHGHDCKRNLRKELKKSEQVLRKSIDQLQEAYCSIAVEVDDTNRERQAVSEKKSELIDFVHKRHDLINVCLQRIKVETLDAVDYYSGETDRTLSILEDEQNATLRQIAGSQEQITKTLDSKHTLDIIKLSQRCAAQRSTYSSKHMKMIRRPALACTGSAGELEAYLESFIGGIHEVLMDVESPGLKIVSRILVSDSGEYKIDAVCHCDSGPPAISVVQVHVGSGVRRRIMVHDTTGERLENVTVNTVAQGKRYMQGELMFATPESDVTSSFSKSLKSDNFKLNTTKCGNGKIMRVFVKSSNPLVLDCKNEADIKVGRHRSFDVDDKEKAFVVLEETEEPRRLRRVRLYRLGCKTHVATYEPPLDYFQPSDVCFYHLKGKQVLLVADEANDVVHVVQVSERKLVFQRYLALGHVAFFKPVCLNVDIRNHLWLACENGQVFCLCE